MLNTVVTFEPPKAKRSIPQCTNCQQYGHTSKCCNRSSVCVKCAGDHHTKNCLIKTRITDVKCALCEKQHPANYKGCEVYKEIQQKTFPSLRQKEIISDKESTECQPQQPNEASPLQQEQRSNPTNYVEGQNIPQTNTNPTYASAVSEISPPTQSQDQNHFEELKNMMKSLMQQMGTLLNLLTVLITNLSK